MPILTRAWQILLKGLSEVNVAPSPLAAAEMILVRLTYAAELPTPGDAVKALQDGDPAATGASSSSSPSTGNGGARASAGGGRTVAEGSPARAPAADPVPGPQARSFPNFEAVAVLAGELREGLLQSFLENQVRIVTFEPGRIEFSADGGADRDTVQRLKGFLEEHSGISWGVALARESNALTIAELRARHAEKARSDAGEHPLVRAVLDQFPGAVVEEVRHVARVPVEAATEPAPDPDLSSDEDDI